ncbi:MAG TPA: dephospho-CoA kinase [Terriglobales bacterium]|nr:dephospho-CoA kinase [Terriglobales bacterium]
MLRVGLTGGIACGKTTVGEMLAKRGAHVIQADLIAHELMQPGQAVYEEVVQHFGREILEPDGKINRQKLATLAFATDVAGSRVQELNRVVHPAVIKRQEEWMEEVGRRERDAIVVVEAALIVEAGVSKRFDKLLVVTCRPEQRSERLAKRLHWDAERARAEVARRMAAQTPEEEKVQAADFVIDNSGTLAETEKQVERVFRELQIVAARR